MSTDDNDKGKTAKAIFRTPLVGIPLTMVASDPVMAGAAGILLDQVKSGTNTDITPQINKTALPPQNEEPIYILNYTDMPTGHVAAYYKGERVDFYPQSLANNSNDLAAAVNIVLGDNDQRTFRQQSHEPANHNDISCYAIYPSQLGITDPSKITQAMQEVQAHPQRYNLYQENCAGQVIGVFNRLGVDMSAAETPFYLPNLPSNVRNFAAANGYRVPYECIPFENGGQGTPQQIYNYHVERQAEAQALQEQRQAAQQNLNVQLREWQQNLSNSNQQQNPTAARESTRVQPQIPNFRAKTGR